MIHQTADNHHHHHHHHHLPGTFRRARSVENDARTFSMGEEAAATTTKKSRHMQTPPEAPVVMEVDDSIPMAINNPDEILVQMVQSGNYSYEEVVQFCLQSAIPISRMLRLDLMRLSQQHGQANK